MYVCWPCTQVLNVGISYGAIVFGTNCKSWYFYYPLYIDRVHWIICLKFLLKVVENSRVRELKEMVFYYLLLNTTLYGLPNFIVIIQCQYDIWISTAGLSKKTKPKTTEILIYQAYLFVNTFTFFQYGCIKLGKHYFKESNYMYMYVDVKVLLNNYRCN